MSATFDPNDPGIGTPDLGEPPIDPNPEPNDPFPGEEHTPDEPAGLPPGVPQEDPGPVVPVAPDEEV